MNDRRFLFVIVFITLIFLSALLSGCGPVKDPVVDPIRSRTAGESGPSDGIIPTDSTNSGAVAESDLPRGFPQQTPLLPGNITLAQHEKSEDYEWYFVNFDKITETDPDAYIERILSSGWEYKNITDFGGGWIITASYRSDYVLQASVFFEDKAGILVVTNDLEAY